MESPISREQYEGIRADLVRERATFIAHWRDLADFVKPRRMRTLLSDRNRGDRRNQKIIDSTAGFALRTLQSGLHAGLTSPAKPWFQLSTPDPELAKFKHVQRWLHEVTERMHAVFLKSNLYTTLPTIYGDQGLFATAAAGLLDDPRDTFRCYPYPIGSYAFGVSDRGTVDTFVREYRMTVRQLVETFGRTENKDIDWSVMSTTVRNMWDRGQFEQTVDVCWIVMPNPEPDPSRIESRFLPWLSVHFEKGADGAKDENVYLRQSGFHEFPILAPRWEAVEGDSYGTESPGMVALGDIRGLQVMTRRKAQAVEKIINPPLQGPSHLKNKKISLLAGDFTAVDVIQQQQGLRPIHEINLSIDHIRADIEDTRFLIRRAFYEDLFLMLAATDRREITAREIEERHEEKLLALGPTIERNNDELHEPLIDRTYAMMERAGLIPDPPEELEGVRLKVEYLSVLSQAQKLVGMSSLQSFMRDTAGLVGIFPEVRHKVKIFPLIDEYANGRGINPDVLASDEEAQAGWSAEIEAAAEQRQAEIAATMARGARDLGAASMEGDNALTRMTEANR